MPTGSVLASDTVQSWRRFFEAELSLHGDQKILSATAEWLLWYDIVKQYSGRSREEWWAFATLLQDTDRLVMLYRIPLEEIESIGGVGGAFFVRLRRLFDEALQAQKATLFLRALAQYQEPIGPIELHGFVDFPPLYQRVAPPHPGLCPTFSRGGEKGVIS